LVFYEIIVRILRGAVATKAIKDKGIN